MRELSYKCDVCGEVVIPNETGIAGRGEIVYEAPDVKVSFVVELDSMRRSDMRRSVEHPALCLSCLNKGVIDHGKRTGHFNG